MFLKLAHTQLEITKCSKSITLSSYQITSNFPPSEKFGITQQIRRAALSVHLNIAEGCSRRSLVERKRFFEISRGSLIEVDTAFEIAIELNYVSLDEMKTVGEHIVSCFKMLSKLINN